MRFPSPGHGYGAAQIAQPIARFIGYIGSRRFELEVRSVAATLDDETGNDSMKNRAFVKPAVHIFEKIFHG